MANEEVGVGGESFIYLALGEKHGDFPPPPLLPNEREKGDTADACLPPAGCPLQVNRLSRPQ